MSTKPIKAPPTAPYDVPDRTRTTVPDLQIAQSAYNAGFRGSALATAVAVALAESHGNIHALNDRGEFSVGLWQMNVNGYLASRLRRWGLTSWIDLWDPDKNAKAAYKVSGGGKNFRPWSTYKHGSYLKYMDRATAAANTVSNPAPNVPTGGTSGSGSQVKRPNILQPAIISNPSTGILEVMLILGIVGFLVFMMVRTQGTANGNS